MSDIPAQRESIYKTSSKNGKFFTTGNVVCLILWGCFPASRQFTKVSKLLAAALCVVRQHRIPSFDDTSRACVCMCVHGCKKRITHIYEFVALVWMYRFSFSAVTRKSTLHVFDFYFSLISKKLLILFKMNRGAVWRKKLIPWTEMHLIIRKAK